MTQITQCTALVIMTNGAHLVVNDQGEPWNAFREKLLQTVLDYMMEHDVRGNSVHVHSGMLVHHDHFHRITGQTHLFAIPIMPMETSVPVCPMEGIRWH